MITPCVRMTSLGEVSSWGKKLIDHLASEKLIEVVTETSWENFIGSFALDRTVPVALIENTAENRAWIEKLRLSKRQCYIAWYGQAFSKEDLAFALEHRIFSVWDSPLNDEKKMVADLFHLNQCIERGEQFEGIIRGAKTLLLESSDSADEGINPQLSELKTAITKLERLGVESEWIGANLSASGTWDDKLPFHRTETFGDALSTVNELERTGVLLVTDTKSNQQGKVEFIQGNIIHAYTDSIRGVKALYRMFLWENSNFIFHRQDPQRTSFEEPISQSLRLIRIEAENLQRRFDSVKQALPPGGLLLELDPSALHSETKLTLEDFSVLASVIEFSQVKQVLDYNMLPDVTIYESLINLKRNGLIRVSVPTVL